jgi:hypothetical protein
MLFSLLKIEADSGETFPGLTLSEDNVSVSRLKNSGTVKPEDNNRVSDEGSASKDETSEELVKEAGISSSSSSRKVAEATPVQTLADISRSWFPSLRVDVANDRKIAGRDLGGISLSISADVASSNFRNMGSSDGIMVGIVGLIGALIAGGFLKLVSFSSAASYSSGQSSSGPTSSTEGLGIAVGIGTWMMYAIRNAFQAAPKRLLTDNVYSVILSAVLRLEVRQPLHFVLDGTIFC